MISKKQKNQNFKPKRNKIPKIINKNQENNSINEDNKENIDINDKIKYLLNKKINKKKNKKENCSENKEQSKQKIYPTNQRISKSIQINDISENYCIPLFI